MTLPWLRWPKREQHNAGRFSKFIPSHKFFFKYISIREKRKGIKRKGIKASHKRGILKAENNLVVRL